MDIKIENLSKWYGRQAAVDGITFQVKTGQILGFLGPNGAGKSTTMKMITGYLGRGSGDILFDGKSILSYGNDLKRNIGYLPENNPLYMDMPVIDYLQFCAALQAVPKNKINIRTKWMVKECGLNDEKHKKIGELSKGYRQRVGLAQALIHDPKVLILDEPTTGLDPNQIVDIRKLIRQLGKEKTVILSTHILPEVESTCDRILIINKGKIVADGTADTLRKQATGREILKLKIENGIPEEILTALQSLSSVEKAELIDRNMDRFEIVSHPGISSKHEVFHLCVSKGWVLTESVPTETSLEDIFRNLTLN
jgi:ABC-2 type transport system ATP-binding protein